MAWLSGQPNVAASIRRSAGVKGDIDHFGATNFLSGLLTMLRDSGYGGLLLVWMKSRPCNACAPIPASGA
jgi:hypothetical protein